MKPIEIQRREMRVKGIDPDCMPAGYWKKVDKKRKAWKASRRGAQHPAKATKAGCDCCRLITHPDEVTP